MKSDENESGKTPAYLDTTLSFEQRADDLIALMTMQEKVSQMVHFSPGIERLDIPDYNWWNECIHGVARAGVATVFPQSIGLAATWNTDLMFRMSTVTSTEARAKYHQAVNEGEPGKQYYGLTFWSPNINIIRDPRWGRSQETYGEDPYLTARMGVAFVKGLQGDDERYLKAAACGKHYAVHNGPEPLRHHFNAIVSGRDLWETYLPAYEALVTEAGVEAIMGAYNRTNGQPCCAHEYLLGEVLRDRWGFDGHVVSDCSAICDIYKNHKYVETPAEASAAAVNAGCDLNCGHTYVHLCRAIELGLISEETVNTSLKRVLMTRFRLGMFDPPEMVPYSDIPPEVNDCPEHRQLSLESARESIVLLKNDCGLLPLAKDIKTVAVIGPNADDIDALMGNYRGSSSDVITPLEGIRRAVSETTTVLHTWGCHVIRPRPGDSWQAIKMAIKADVVVMVMGLSSKIEGEEGDATDSESNGDRVHIELPDPQKELLKAIAATGKPIVLVLLGGSSIAIPWAAENIPAILMTWYGGEEAGTALADVLFGDYNPAGRLPVTFYRGTDQLGDFEDYSMAGKTYRYFEGEPVWPFGFGLSYTRFEYADLEISSKNIPAGQSVEVSATVANAGDCAGDEVVQVYLRDVEASVPHPIRSLVGFDRIHLAGGESRKVSFTIAPDRMQIFNDDGSAFIEPGRFEVSIGGGQPVPATGERGYVIGEFEVTA